MELKDKANKQYVETALLKLLHCCIKNYLRSLIDTTCRKADTPASVLDARLNPI